MSVGNLIGKEDIVDSDFVDAYELSSDGYLAYLQNVTVTNIDNATKKITVSGFNILYSHDDPVEVGDRVRITDSSTADGYYTIASLVDNSNFTVVESINSATTGKVAFLYGNPGAKYVGYDKTQQSVITASNVQDALTQLSNGSLIIPSPTQGDIVYYNGSNWDKLPIGNIDEFLTSTGTAPLWKNHDSIRKLIHLANNGPFEGFASGSYKETLPSADPFPTSVIWYTSSAKTHKIVEKQMTYNSNKTINTIIWKAYDTDGSSVLVTITDTISYSSVFETNRTRTIS